MVDRGEQRIDSAQSVSRLRLAAVYAPSPHGHMKCDGMRDGRDIDLFVHVLLNQAGFMNDHPGCPIVNADFDGDNLVTAGDAPGFTSAPLGR